MTVRQVPGRARAAALLGVALCAVLLAGCTSAFLAADGSDLGAAPSGPTATPDAIDSGATPPPVTEFDCDNVLIDRPGNYALGDCGLVTIEGGGIDLAFSSIAKLVVRGDGVEIVGERLDVVEIEGERSDIEVLSVGSLTIRGERNTVVADGAIDTVVVQGNENVVTAGDGIGSSVDNGLLNEID